MVNAVPGGEFVRSLLQQLRVAAEQSPAPDVRAGTDARPPRTSAPADRRDDTSPSPIDLALGDVVFQWAASVCNSGKQGYGNARGFWQTVYLETRGDTYLDALHITPDIDAGKVRITALLPEATRQNLKLDLEEPSIQGDVAIVKGKTTRSGALNASGSFTAMLGRQGDKWVIKSGIY